eukprot:scaffold2140_cov394-Prasinococcus_capsulatus_cf.AAC.14
MPSSRTDARRENQQPEGEATQDTGVPRSYIVRELRHRLGHEGSEHASAASARSLASAATKRPERGALPLLCALPPWQQLVSHATHLDLGRDGEGVVVIHTIVLAAEAALFPALMLRDGVVVGSGAFDDTAVLEKGVGEGLRLHHPCCAHKGRRRDHHQKTQRQPHARCREQRGERVHSRADLQVIGPIAHIRAWEGVRVRSSAAT